MHVEQVLGDVPRQQRCQGHAVPADKPKADAQTPPREPKR
jgi:hypothetical protein